MGWKILSPKFLRTFGVLFRLVANTMETSLELTYQITSSPTVAVLAVTKFHFCCIALTCQTYFLQFLNFMSGGALVSQHGAWATSRHRAITGLVKRVRSKPGLSANLACG